ncbi:DNA primase [Candidatus Uhrbacteria bacterium]|nr:DNA primase [Candidatus Uhrbacteria bacterium]
MDAVQDIKGRLDIVDVVSEYIPLKPGGSGAFRANCPFHSEKTPSFYVSRPRQTWHCFGCDQGGDSISFVMRMEGMEFREALEHLAQKTGVVLPKFDGEKASQRKRLHEVNDIAMRFFRASLQNLPTADHARTYLAKRGVDDLTADLFQIGYAPESWDALTMAMLSKGVTESEMLLAGVVGKREKGTGVYDRFRNRLMFPIGDVHGNIVGFTGRILTDSKEEAKYVNTPETPLYRKSAILYGLDKAKGEIRRQDLAVIAEGNMDVVGSHQFGVTHVVASSGTALTSEQLGLLKRFTTNLAIAFDQDNAGHAATLRGLDLARAQDFNIKVITLPPEAGKDPDDAVRKNPELWKQAIKDAVGIMEWIYRNAFRNRSTASPEDKKLIAKDVLLEVKRIADPVERDHWVKRLAKDIDIGEQALRDAMVRAPSATTTKAPTAKAATPTVATRADIGWADHENRLFALAIYRPELWKAAISIEKIGKEDFEGLDLSTLYGNLQISYDPDISVKADLALANQTIRPPATLTPDEAKNFDALAFLAEREYQGQSLEELKRELNTAAGTLRLQRKKRERLQLEQYMREAERLGDQERILDLQKRFNALN